MIQKQEAQDLRDVMVQTLIQAVEKKMNIAVVVSDSTSTSKIVPFQEKFPQRVVNVGIAEQNAVGVAAGLSLGGYIAVTANAVPFLAARANEQVKNDVCYSETNVKLVGLNAGVCYGNLGSTHHAIDDISIMRGLGNIQILAPADPLETRQMFDYALQYEGPVYIRLDSAKFPVLHTPEYQFEPGNIDVLREGKNLTIAAVGSVVHEAVAAAQELATLAIDAEVLNLSSIRPLNPQKMIDSLRKTKQVITVEEHSMHGGIGSLVAEMIAENGLAVSLKRLGIPEGQFSKAGPRAALRAYYQIDARGIAANAQTLVSMCL
ncbi:MAG: transketolase C-terminal domain-containing protein [Candidatus Vecturithrix sp.]|jgi:transketolase|nr:transketolase C-terminal domain-containing protein [Candidatus Vecturithrix sp.]